MSIESIFIELIKFLYNNEPARSANVIKKLTIINVLPMLAAPQSSSTSVRCESWFSKGRFAVLRFSQPLHLSITSCVQRYTYAFEVTLFVVV